MLLLLLVMVEADLTSLTASDAEPKLSDSLLVSDGEGAATAAVAASEAAAAAFNCAVAAWLDCFVFALALLLPLLSEAVSVGVLVAVAVC